MIKVAIDEEVVQEINELFGAIILKLMDVERKLNSIRAMLPADEQAKPADTQAKPAKAARSMAKPDKPKIDREVIRGALKKYGAIEGHEAALEILKRFGASTMGALAEKDFEACYEAVLAALKTAEESKAG